MKSFDDSGLKYHFAIADTLARSFVIAV